MTDAALPLMADLTEARRLLDAGLHLVALRPLSKAPPGLGWNKPENRLLQIPADLTGCGLPLALNNLCSVDPDDVARAFKILPAIAATVAPDLSPIDWPALLSRGVRTVSTRPGSGGRYTFRATPDLSWLAFRTKEAGTILELRAHSPNLQDCVPGLIYLDAAGEVRTQHYADDTAHKLDDAPELPAELLEIWARMSRDPELYRRAFRAAAEALGETIHSLPLGDRGALPFSSPHRRWFNETYTVEQVLLQAGYLLDGDRFKRPGSTGAPGIYKIPGTESLWRCEHGGSPLHGQFDGWGANVVLLFEGNLQAADLHAAKLRAAEDAEVAERFRQAGAALAQQAGLDATTEPPPIGAAGTAPPPPPLSSPNPGPFLVLNLFDLLSRSPPPLEFVWEGLVPRGALTLMAGHGGTGKSMIALMLAISVAAGRPVFGRATTPGLAVFFSGEDPLPVLWRRIRWVMAKMGLSVADLGGRLIVIDATVDDPVLVAPPANNARGALAATATYHALVGLLGTFSFGPDLVVIDNASDAYAGSEIDRQGVRGFLRSLLQLVPADRRERAAVLLLSHVNKQTASGKSGESYSGSTAWHNSVRSRLVLTGGDGELVLEQEKLNLGARKSEPLHLEWHEGELPTVAEAPAEDDQQVAAFADADFLLAWLDQAIKGGSRVTATTLKDVPAQVGLGWTLRRVRAALGLLKQNRRVESQKADGEPAPDGGRGAFLVVIDQRPLSAEEPAATPGGIPSGSVH